MKILPLLIIGAAAGLIGALCGVGGGIIMVPAMTLALGIETKKAIATSMAVIAITAIIATANNSRVHDLVQWKIVAVIAISSSLFAWFGSNFMRELSNPVLTKIFASVMILVGIRMLWK
jgi:uncharacterized protein